MHVRVVVDGERSDDHLRSLREWLAGADGLRGRVTGEESPPPPGTLGPVLDALAVALGPGGAATALAVGLISWIRHRGSEVNLRVTRSDGASVELSAKRIQGLDSAELRAHLHQLTRALEAGADDEDRSGGSDAE